VQRAAQPVGLSFRIEDPGGGKGIGIERENGAVFGTLMVEARDTAQISRCQSLGGDRARSKRPYQRGNRLFGRIEAALDADGTIAGRRSGRQSPCRLDENSSIHGIPSGDF